MKMLMPLLIKRYTKAPAKSPKKPRQSLHSVEIHLWHHSGGVGRNAGGFYEIGKAFTWCVILPPGVSEHFPKVTFALLFTHPCQVSPSHHQRQISQHVLVWLGSSSVLVLIMAFSAYLLTLFCLFSPCTGRKRARKIIFSSAAVWGKEKNYASQLFLNDARAGFMVWFKG